MKTKDEVKNLLIKAPHLRDSDQKLIATFWFNELKAKSIDPDEITCYEFMKMFAESKLTNIKTIERMRRKIQEESPEFRGQVYNSRKGVIQDKWRSELGYENS
tara:strand:+ start:796 stop:1104 length:309 start_codon:yes stop_codon:yes gene_type:complete